jgi:hypothetical protein
VADSRSKERSASISQSQGRTAERSSGTTSSKTLSHGQAKEQGKNWSVSTTDQPGTQHIPFWEEDPEHWSLEEQRWRASELVMAQNIGHWFIRTSTTCGFGSNGLPKPFYILPNQMLRLTHELYKRHNLTAEQADELIRQRQAELRRSIAEHANLAVRAARTKSGPVNGKAAVAAPLPVFPHSWTRTEQSVKPSPPVSTPEPANVLNSARKRGPKPDMQTHLKIAEIAKPYGEAWTEESNLYEICAKLDEERIPVPKTWPEDRQHPSTRWLPALLARRTELRKSIAYHCRCAAQAVKAKSESSSTLAEE